MSKPPLNILKRNSKQRLFECLDQVWERTGFESTQDGLNLRPGQFNRIEVRRVRRQIDQVRSTPLDQGFNPSDLVGRQVVHEQDVARLQRWDDALLDVAIEDVAIDSTRHDQRCRDARRANYGQRRGSCPRRQRGILHHALIGCGAPIQSRQTQIDARFVEKFEPFNIQGGYFFLKVGPLPLDARRVALTGVERLFLNGSFSRANSRHIILGSDLILQSRSTRAHNSCKVASACSFTAARMTVSAAANLRTTPPAWGNGAQLPVARCRANQRSIDGSLTLYRRAASGILLSPLSTVLTTRSRRSVEYAFIPSIMPSSH